MNSFKLICILCCFSISVNAQNIPQILNLRTGALKTMRNFRDKLNEEVESPARDSLLEQTAMLISYARTLKDTSQLMGLNNYFEMASMNYSGGSLLQKMAVIGNLKNDINFKISARLNGSELNLSPSTVIFEDTEVKVAVTVSGQVPKANYTLFWTYFTGVDQGALIKTKSKAGNSVTFGNPYKLTIKLPGFITFWLLDTNTEKVFKCVPDHLQMVPQNKSIAMNFIPFNP